MYWSLAGLRIFINDGKAVYSSCCSPIQCLPWEDFVWINHRAYIWKMNQHFSGRDLRRWMESLLLWLHLFPVFLLEVIHGSKTLVLKYALWTLPGLWVNMNIQAPFVLLLLSLFQKPAKELRDMIHSSPLSGPQGHILWLWGLQLFITIFRSCVIWHSANKTEWMDVKEEMLRAALGQSEHLPP